MDHWSSGSSRSWLNSRDITNVKLFAGKYPTGLGIQGGRLAPLPRSPNAVSSESMDPRHAIAPLQYSGAPDYAMRALANIVVTLPRTRLTTSTERYLHAECESPWLGFVDDLELHLNEHELVIHVRSASRLGYSDFGVNRARVESLRRLWAGYQGWFRGVSGR